MILYSQLENGQEITRQEIIPDFNHRIGPQAQVFSDQVKTIILSSQSTLKTQSVNVKLIKAEAHNIESYWSAIFEAGIYSLMIEGGQKLIKSVLASNLWDEARIINTPKMLGMGIKAPSVKGRLHQKQQLSDDFIATILNEGS